MAWTAALSCLTSQAWFPLLCVVSRHRASGCHCDKAAPPELTYRSGRGYSHTLVRGHCTPRISPATCSAEQAPEWVGEEGRVLHRGRRQGPPTGANDCPSSCASTDAALAAELKQNHTTQLWPPPPWGSRGPARGAQGPDGPSGAVAPEHELCLPAAARPPGWP